MKKECKELLNPDTKQDVQDLLKNKQELSNYSPSDEEKEMRSRILKDFQIVCKWIKGAVTGTIEFSSIVN